MKEKIQEHKVPLIVGALVLLAVLAFMYKNKLASFFLYKGGLTNAQPATMHPTVTSNNSTIVDRDALLQKGSKGKQVEELQQLLNVKHGSSGPSFYEYLTVDGIFGSATEAMLKKYTGRTSISINDLLKALK